MEESERQRKEMENWEHNRNQFNETDLTVPTDLERMPFQPLNDNPLVSKETPKIHSNPYFVSNYHNNQQSTTR